jgi:hypothetical protein
VSVNKTRKTGQTAQPRPGLRPVLDVGERPRSAPDPKLKAALDNIRRRALERREREDDEPEAA